MNVREKAKDEVEREGQQKEGQGVGPGFLWVSHSNTCALTGHNSRAAAKRSVSNEVGEQQQICWSRL